MSADIQNGDRVRGVLEGRVLHRSDHDPSVFIQGDRANDAGWFPLSQVAKVLPPLPTTPGSVVRESGCFLVLSTALVWGCPDHGRSEPQFFGDVEVIFDAGAK